MKNVIVLLFAFVLITSCGGQKTTTLGCCIRKHEGVSK